MGEQIDGLLVVDKPAGMTSHDVVSRVRRLAGQRKVGHAGTLDPDATGVLVVGLGKATRLLTYITGASKTYRATIRLGIETLTEDAAGEWTVAAGCQKLSPAEIDREISALTGEILQVPSRVSAIKVDGKRAYARIRAGETVALAARPVTIRRFERIGDLRPQVAKLQAGESLAPAAGADSQEVPVQEVPVIDFEAEIDCSKGTYIRALARDLGKALECGAHLTALRRIRVGAWTLADAVQLPELPAELPPVISVSQAALQVFPAAILDESSWQKFLHGQAPQAVTYPVAHTSGASTGAFNDSFDQGEIFAAVCETDPLTVGGLIRANWPIGEAKLPANPRWSTVAVFAGL